MDHKTAYAYHLAKAIRHKKAMALESEAKEVTEPLYAGDTDAEDDFVADEPDPRLARKERIKEILSR